MNDKFDVIIIGSGLGGLTAGAKLAKAGKKVLILEQHNKPGGFSTNFKRKGYIFDVSLHNFGSIYDNPSLLNIFNELNLFKDLKFIPFDEYQRVIFPDDDILIKKGIDAFINELVKRYPEEKKGIEKLFETIKSLKKEFDEIEKLNISMDKLITEYPLLPIKFPLLVKLAEKSFDNLLCEYIKNEKLKGIVGFNWQICGLPPNRVASILYSIPTTNLIEHSGGYIEGSSQKLSDILSQKIVDNNGVILTNTKVEKIIVENNKVCKVVIKNQHEYYSEIVISNISPQTSYRLAGISEKKSDKMENSLSAVQLYLGLDINPDKLGIKNHNLTVFYDYDHGINYQKIVEGDYEKTFFSATNYTNIDSSLIPQGKGILTVMSLDHIKNWEDLSQEEYLKKKNEVSKIIIKKIEKYYKNISDHIVVSELATPVTMKRYTLHPEGAIYGFSQNIKQSGVNRFSQRSKIEGLFFTGSNVYPGAGYCSVMTAGALLSEKILKL